MKPDVKTTKKGGTNEQNDRLVFAGGGTVGYYTHGDR